MRVRSVAAAVSVSLVWAAWVHAEEQPAAPPMVVGQWIGEWGALNPAKSDSPDPARCKALECSVVETGGTWQATFEGECGRPYKYVIKMPGRLAGNVVLFQGSTDLGEADGGVHDWIGRATSDEFIGFYTSANHTGFFRLKRPATAIGASETSVQP